MNYELASALRDGGYPQKSGWYVSESERAGAGSAEEMAYMTEMVGDPEAWAYVPTLAELIEACGKRFQALELYPLNIHPWLAVSRPQNDWEEYNGNTPEEAVKNLWLALRQTVVDAQ